MPVATVSAQDWSELNTLTFTPVSLERSLAVGTAGAPENGSERPVAGYASEPVPQIVISRIQAVLDDIESDTAENGENSPGLYPLLLTLAGIYQQIGDYGDAIVALDRAQGIVRRWEGLYSLDQADVVEQLIEIETSITPGEQVIGLESDLRELVRRNPGDPRNVEILMNMAGRQMDMVRHLLVNGLPPEFILNIGSVNGLGRTRFAPPRTARSMAASMLRTARSSYGSAMREAMIDGATDIPLLLELEDSIIDTYYFELMNPALRRDRQSYRGAGRLRFGGVNALEAKLSNSRRYPGTPEAVASNLIEIADWNLMFYAFGHAMGIYETARAYLLDQERGEERVAAMFSPEAPVPLPAFMPNTNVYSDRSNVHGYVDVEIVINRFGGVRDVTVTGGSENASESVERRLKRFVYQSRFRPRFVDGEWQRNDRFVQRYEFGYSST